MHNGHVLEKSAEGPTGRGHGPGRGSNAGGRGMGGRCASHPLW